MTKEPTQWLCCQLGAREHYAVPRSLLCSGGLGALLTDYWAQPRSIWSVCHRKLRERYHPELNTARVTSWNADLLAFELSARAKRLAGFPLTMRRNRWFQSRVLKALASISKQTGGDHGQPVLFAYSYAALELLQFARERGWRTVLGQIDPGPVMERIVARLNGDHPSLSPETPGEYWRQLRAEWEAADHIVVNSAWSRECLIQEGVSAEKLSTIPLAYEPPAAASGFERRYPAGFSSARPMRVLFLGQGTRLKGLKPLLDTVSLLDGEPIEFWIVGPVRMDISPELASHPRIRWIGPVPRGAAETYYRKADVFVFPSFCDGFGLTQLEAQAWKLPVIASRFCGDVVEHGRNGWLLPEVSAQAIAERLTECVRNPDGLVAAADESGVANQFSLTAFGASLSRLPR